MYNREKWSLSVFYVKYICTITTGCATTSWKIITTNKRLRNLLGRRKRDRQDRTKADCGGPNRIEAYQGRQKDITKYMLAQ